MSELNENYSGHNLTAQQREEQVALARRRLVGGGWGGTGRDAHLSARILDYEATVAALEAELVALKAKDAPATLVRCDTCIYWERAMQLLRGMGEASPSEYGLCSSGYTTDFRTHEGERVCPYYEPKEPNG
jgi:hypothetical protein